MTFPPGVWGSAINHSMHPEMKVSDPWRVVFAVTPPPPRLLQTPFFLQITHPAGCMSQFTRFFGEQIMVLWKLALLRRRILIFSPPPVGVVCYRGASWVFLSKV